MAPAEIRGRGPTSAIPKSGAPLPDSADVKSGEPPPNSADVKSGVPLPDSADVKSKGSRCGPRFCAAGQGGFRRPQCSTKGNAQ